MSSNGPGGPVPFFGGLTVFRVGRSLSISAAPIPSPATTSFGNVGGSSDILARGAVPCVRSSISETSDICFASSMREGLLIVGLAPSVSSLTISMSSARFLETSFRVPVYPGCWNVSAKAVLGPGVGFIGLIGSSISSITRGGASNSTPTTL